MSIASLVKKLYKIRDMEKDLEKKEETVCKEVDSHVIIDHLVFLRNNAEAPDLKKRIQERIDHVCEHMLEKEMDSNYVHNWEDCND